MFKNVFAKGISKHSRKELYHNTEEMPYLVQYICNNVPLKELPINSIYFFTEDAHDLFKIRISPGTHIVPVIIHKISECNFNFYNYELKLVGYFSFSKDFKILKTFGKDFEHDCINYQLLELFSDSIVTNELIRQKFGNIQISGPKYKN